MSSGRSAPYWRKSGKPDLRVGGSATTTNYIWCGERICQARNSANAVTRSYCDEGEYVPGSPAQAYYYGIDQLASVCRAFASTTSAPAFGYDPYGNALPRLRRRGGGTVASAETLNPGGYKPCGCMRFR